MSPAPLVSDGVAPDPAPSSRPQSDADRAQAAMFAQLLSEHRSRIALALDDVDPADPDQARLDRAALRKELREVSAVLDTIDRRTT
ncbi:hypothetical protein [Williamsia deligens]|uniref:DUF465 domain-containing protein n=1 Tax=Williamsia deligens TaxID=321325 RepID=A0ABW3G2A2_9NOCA|nr:hypothetical protein [Williamsia deligens]